MHEWEELIYTGEMIRVQVYDVESRLDEREFCDIALGVTERVLNADEDDTSLAEAMIERGMREKKV